MRKVSITTAVYKDKPLFWFDPRIEATRVGSTLCQWHQCRTRICQTIGLIHHHLGLATLCFPKHVSIPRTYVFDRLVHMAFGKVVVLLVGSTHLTGNTARPLPRVTLLPSYICMRSGQNPCTPTWLWTSVHVPGGKYTTSRP